MITNKELEIANDSYTKKDFYQIYPEILDLVTKISERWDPQSSNESDPGVVLLKVLAFVADKNNYNIDKNILEAFMPSATQEDSMRKLCDMMGYNMKYYQSATTQVSFMYQGADLDGGKITSFTLPAFTVISNEDDDVEYVITEPITIDKKYTTKSVLAIEGTYCNALASEDDVVKLSNLDDNNRFYLPESQIAENGVFIKNVDDEATNTWEKVNNLNIKPSLSYAWKFGYDSQKGLPYIQFPDDIANLIGDGLNIHYMRTQGENGNVSANTLIKLTSLTEQDGVYLSNDTQTNIVISNLSASSNGANKETLDSAYNNFKRTIGTFNTLVTCRDYANAIYNLVSGVNDTTPLVSNIQVGDIRDDINMSNNILTFNDYGIVNKLYTNSYAVGDTTIPYDVTNINIYPYTPITSSYTKASFNKSFKPDSTNLAEIEADIDGLKTISHVFSIPSNSEYYCIKNYYTLKAKITTTYKVNTSEEASILANVYSALYKAFNMRKIAFGEKIPFDMLFDCMQKADSRIKTVSLEEPTLKTKVMFADVGLTEHILNDADDTIAREAYIDLLSKNILAGRVNLLNYDTKFSYALGQTAINDTIHSINQFPEVNYGGGSTEDTQITTLASTAAIPTNENTILEANEFVQFRAPNFATKITYPAYVNYYFTYSNSQSFQAAVPAKFKVITAAMIQEAAGASQTTITAENMGAVNAVYPIYVYYSQDNDKYGVGGYLIDSSGIKYKKLVSYIANIVYYTPVIENGVQMLGKDAIYPCIPANSIYMLTGDDKLFVNYTDTDGGIHNIEYTATQITTNGVSETVSHNIICPNFDLADSRTTYNARLKSWSKTSGYDFSVALDGMFSLSSSEQIELKDYVQTTLKTTENCYWLLNHKTINEDGDIIVDLGSRFINNEYTLEDGEYFFYTNDAKTELVTLGSGTKLIKAANIIFPKINYSNNKLDIDSVASNGLAAFNAIDWKVMRFTSASTLVLQEMRYLTLAEGDGLKVVLEDAADSLNNTWQNVASADFIMSGVHYSALDSLPVDSTNNQIYWEARSRLDLNCSPTASQTLVSARQTMKFYYADSTSLIPHFETITGNAALSPSFKTNYVLQKTGSDAIDVSTFVYNQITDTETEVNDFAISIFNKNSVTKTTGNTTDTVAVTDSRDEFTQLSFKDMDSINLPIVIPEGEFGIIMVYYKQASTNETLTITTTADSGFSITKYNGVALANNQLTPGINVLKIDRPASASSTSLIITKGGTAEAKKSGTIIFNGLSNIIATNRGVNITTLGITSSDEATSLLAKLSTQATITTTSGDIFFYNHPDDKNILIDSNLMSDALTYYDSNNILNKFVISELDSSSFASNITLTKGSRL